MDAPQQPLHQASIPARVLATLKLGLAVFWMVLLCLVLRGLPAFRAMFNEMDIKAVGLAGAVFYLFPFRWAAYALTAAIAGGGLIWIWHSRDPNQPSGAWVWVVVMTMALLALLLSAAVLYALVKPLCVLQ